MGRTGRAVSDATLNVEFLAPRDSAFGGGTAEFAGIDVDDEPQPKGHEPTSRWLIGVASVAVIALVAGGVLSAAPWRNGERAPIAAPPTTVASTTSAGAVQPLDGQTGYILDPVPTGFHISSVQRSSVGVAPVSPTGWGQVWATSDATVDSGSWFSVTVTGTNGSISDLVADATRIDLNGRIGLLSKRGDGTLVLGARVVPGTSQRLTIRSFGLTTQQLVQLYRTFGVKDGRPTPLDTMQLGAHELLIDRATDQDLIDEYLTSPSSSSTTYVADTSARSIDVSTSDRDPDLDRLAPLAFALVRFPASLAPPVGSSIGDGAVLGTPVPNDGSGFIARWHDGDTTVLVRANMPVTGLVDVLPSIRRATADEWVAVQRDVARSDDETETESVQAGGGTPFGNGTLADGTPWSATVQPPNHALLWFGDQSVHFPLSGMDADPIDLWTTERGTIVTAVVPDGVQAASLRVSADGVTLAEVEFADVTAADRRSSFTGRTAALALDHFGTFRVDIVMGDGTVLSALDSPGST